jgi:putative ABC transport system permease protein
MLKNYLLVALRNLRKQKLFSLINIMGLAIGMAGFAIFALTAGIKLNADTFHKDADRIYSLVQVLPADGGGEEHTAYTPHPLMQAALFEFPEIEDGVRILPASRMPLWHEDLSFYENHILFVDPGFLTFFTFEMVLGSRETALDNPNSIVLSETAAEKYFGEQDPIGKLLTLGKDQELMVTGVVKDIPRTSSIRFGFLVSMKTAQSLHNIEDDWNENKCATFVKLRAEQKRAGIDEKFAALIQKYYPDSP